MSEFNDLANRFVDTAACGDLDEVKVLLSSTDPLLTPEMINKVDKDGKSAFHYACLNDDVKLLRILLDDPRVDVHLTSRNGENGLHMAALYSSLEVLALLHSDNRLNINAQNIYGETPLHLCAGSGDKSAPKTAIVLLSCGASLTVTDKWKRGPMDVSQDNSENSVLSVLREYINERDKCPIEVYEAVTQISTAYKDDTNRTNEAILADGLARRKSNANNLFNEMSTASVLAGGIAGVKLKKTSTVVKTMFKVNEGSVSSDSAVRQTTSSGDTRKSLSKLVEFPGDLDEIKKHLENPEVNPAGADAYGVCAIHKFASWNKTDYLDVLLPTLTPDQVNAVCPSGKSALHYAVEMASVGGIKTLMKAGIDVTIRDKRGFTVSDILNNATNSAVIERLKNALENP